MEISGLFRHQPILGIALAAVLSMVSTANISAQPGGNGPNRSQGPGEAESDISVTVGISVDEARELAIAGGHTGRQGLPPGIARNLQRGKPLPPGIAKQTVPESMLADLPRIEDQEWVIAGSDLVLIAVGSAIVVSILNDVFD